jgi:hypothetical protein
MYLATSAEQLAVDSSDGITNEIKYLDFILRTALCDLFCCCLDIPELVPRKYGGQVHSLWRRKAMFTITLRSS